MLPEVDSLESLRELVQSGARPKYVFFWTHVTSDTRSVGKECLSQWYPAPFEAYGHHFATAEHFTMYRKAVLFGDDTTALQILAAPTPNAVNALGRTVRGFDEAVWQSNRFAVVAECSRLKFTSDAKLREFLLSTKEHILAEACPTDRVWGIGLTADDKLAKNPLHWRGLNLLGFALMLARSELKAGVETRARRV